MGEAFGDKVKDFSFNENNELTFSGNTKGLSGRQKKLLEGVRYIMDSEDITEVVFGESVVVKDVNGNDVTLNTEEGGGAGTVLKRENEDKNLDRNYIIINPEVKETTVNAVTPLFYRDIIDPNAGASFKPVTIQLTTGDMLFHEFGHLIYEGQTQDKVLKYNNYFRKLSDSKKDPTMKAIIPNRSNQNRMCSMYKYITLIIIGVLCSCIRGNYDGFKEKYVENDSIDISISYLLSMSNDTLDLCLTNLGDEEIILFDSYLNDHEFSMGILEGDAIYRYNSDRNTFLVSFLPLLPFLSSTYGDLIVFGKRRITRGLGSTIYSFRPIGVNETICLHLPFVKPRIDKWQKDIDVKKFNKWDRQNIMKFQPSDHCLSESDAPEVFLELAIYSDTLSLTKYDYYMNEFDFNNKIKNYKTLYIPLTQDIIEMIFRD